MKLSLGCSAKGPIVSLEKQSMAKTDMEQPTGRVEDQPLLPKEPHEVAWDKVGLEGDSVVDDLPMEPHMQQAMNIHEAAQSGSGINVYHITAFFPKSENYCRAFLCIVLQVVIVPSIIANTFVNSPKLNDSFCPSHGSWVGKLAGCALLVYALDQLRSQDFTFGHSWDVACIRKGAPLLKLVSHTSWIPIGIIVNIIALAASNVGVVVLLFFSDTAMDMLLNLVALTFVFELDDQLMATRDYKATEILFREAALGKDLKDFSQKLRNRGYFEPHTFHKSWRYLVIALDGLVTSPLYLFMMAAPFYHAICY